MAKRAGSRRLARGRKRAKPAKKKASMKRSVKRQKSARSARSARKARPARAKAKSRRPAKRASAPAASTATPRLNRARRTLEEEIVPTPPSSLNLNRHGSAVRSGRAEMLDSQRKHGKMKAVTAGDVDVDVEDAYFTGEEAPGGDNPTPDSDVVDDIGKALGVEYQDDEELKGSDKVAERDKHRWELDPASSEDYKGRK